MPFQKVPYYSIICSSKRTSAIYHGTKWLAYLYIMVHGTTKYFRYKKNVQRNLRVPTYILVIFVRAGKKHYVQNI